MSGWGLISTLVILWLFVHTISGGCKLYVLVANTNIFFLIYVCSIFNNNNDEQKLRVWMWRGIVLTCLIVRGEKTRRLVIVAWRTELSNVFTFSYCRHVINDVRCVFKYTLSVKHSAFTGCRLFSTVGTQRHLPVARNDQTRWLQSNDTHIFAAVSTSCVKAAILRVYNASFS
jgi:hypothetical protein